MKSKGRIVGLPGVVIFLLLPPCLFAAEPEPAVAEKPIARMLPKDPEATMRGIVLDNRQPVVGAIVQAHYLGWSGRGWGEYTTEEVVTDKNGRFAITVPRRRMSGIQFIARSADSRRMGLLKVGSSSDPENAYDRYRNEDSARMKDLEVWLAPAVSRRIQVVDGQGKPVAGANAGVFLGHWHFAKMKTGKNGTARIWLPATVSNADLFAWKPGLGLDFARWQADAEKGPMKLTLRKAPDVFVQVRDAITNQPVPDAAVSITIPRKPETGGSYAGLQYGFGITATTDREGQAKIDWLPEWLDKQNVTIWGRHPKYSIMSEVPKLTVGPKRQSVTMKLQPLVRLRGRVLFPNGKPAAGIVVESAKGDELFRERTITDQNGEYELAVGPDLKCIVVVVDDKWGAEPQTEFTVEVPGLSAKVPEIRLAPAKRIHGKLTTEDKTPVAGEPISLHLYGPPRGEKQWPNKNFNHDDPHATLTTWTDKNGQYEFRVGPGVFRIQGPKALESADGVHYFARGYMYWSRNLPASKKSMEYDIVRPVWTEMP